MSTESVPQAEGISKEYLEKVEELRLLTGKPEADTFDHIHERCIERRNDLRRSTFKSEGIRIGDIQLGHSALARDVPTGTVRDLLGTETAQRRILAEKRKIRIDEYRKLVRAGQSVPILVCKSESTIRLFDGVYRLLALSLECSVEASPDLEIYLQPPPEPRTPQSVREMPPEVNWSANRTANTIWRNACDEVPRVTLATKRRLLLARLARYYLLKDPDQVAYSEDLELTEFARFFFSVQRAANMTGPSEQGDDWWSVLEMEAQKIGIPSRTYLLELVECFAIEQEAIDRQFSSLQNGPSDPKEALAESVQDLVNANLHVSRCFSDQEGFVEIMDRLQSLLRNETRKHPLMFITIASSVLRQLQEHLLEYERDISEILLDTRPAKKRKASIERRMEIAIQAYFRHHMNGESFDALKALIERQNADKSDVSSEVSKLKTRLFPKAKA